MPRREWHNEQLAQDWLRILMGPRPPSVRWPRAQQNRRNQPPGPKQGREQEAGVQRRRIQWDPRASGRCWSPPQKQPRRHQRELQGWAVSEDSDEVVQLKDFIEESAC